MLLLNLLAFCAGVLAVGIVPRLPTPAIVLLIIALGLGCLLRRRWRTLGAGLLGVGWACVQGYATLALLLPDICSKTPLYVEGRVVGLPQPTSQGIKFELAMSAIAAPDAAACAKALQGYSSRLLLHYPLPTVARSTPVPATPVAALPVSGRESLAHDLLIYEHPILKQLVPNQRLRLQVALTPARGLVNFSGFDYQVWLLRQGIGARGRVLGSVDLLPARIDTHWLGARIDLWRWHLSRWLAAEPLDNTGVLTALLIGENDFIAPEVWRLWMRSGISHLVAVSGLHIGFVALVGFFIGSGLGRVLQVLPYLRLRLLLGPAARMGALVSLLAAGFYSALAGFNIPTLRTFVMIALFNLSLMLYRRIPLWSIYIWALLVTLLLDPLAGYDMGFWLSFMAVGLLIFHFGGRRFLNSAPRQTGRMAAHGTLASAARRFRQFISSQWLMLVGLFLPLALLVNTVPLLAPISNLLAIPIVTFWVVPLLLLAALLHALAQLLGLAWCGFVATALLQLADKSLSALRAALEALLAKTDAIATPVIALDGTSLVLVALFSALLMVPRAFKIQYLLSAIGWVMVALAVLKHDTRPALEVVVLDVGQGSAALVRVGDYTLVVDIGPQYSSRFSAATGVLLPYLAARGIGAIDDLVISHWDQDHAGDFTQLLQRLSVARVLAGESAPPSQIAGIARDTAINDCHSTAPWQVGAVQLRFVNQHMTRPADNRNDSSCVLVIEIDQHALVLPGDLSRAGEWQLLRGAQLPAQIDLLVAGHHGSRSSSNPAFTRYLQPRWVVYSSGYGNRYGHPHAEVVERFTQLNARQFNTATDGAVRYRYWPDRGVEVDSARQLRRRYWQERPREFK